MGEEKRRPGRTRVAAPTRVARQVTRSQHSMSGVPGHDPLALTRVIALSLLGTLPNA